MFYDVAPIKIAAGVWFTSHSSDGAIVRPFLRYVYEFRCCVLLDYSFVVLVVFFKKGGKGGEKKTALWGVAGGGRNTAHGRLGRI